ncbi:MAG: glycosyltransferase family 4 protein [Chthoniobacter sp.]|nr:glycosyltransferase family 4 protein [Chthoniobacter sp.]
MAERRIAFVYIKGRLARLPEVRCGTAPTEFFYGAIELERQGWKIEHYEIDPDAPGDLLARALTYLFPLSCRPVKMDPRLLTRGAALAERLNACDCIVATAGNIAFALALLTKLGRIRRPVIGIQCGVLNYPHNFIRKAVSRRLLARMHSMLFADGELAEMRAFFGLPEERIVPNEFGVDLDFWKPGDGATGDYVLSVGNDGQRDYETLLRAAPQIGCPIRIITRRPLPLPLPPNVTHIAGSWHGRELDDDALREVYRGARCVVVPIRPTLQPSGQSVTLQAMACGTPVVLTETAGLWSRKALVSGDNILLARPGDAADLAKNTHRVLEEGELRMRLVSRGLETVRNHGDIRLFAERTGELIERCSRSAA